MQEEAPLFGEEKPGVKWVVWIVGILTTIFVVFCTISGIVFGVKRNTPQHFLLVAVLLCICVILIILFRWYKQGDLDPKFRFLIFSIVVLVFLTGAVLLAYVWPEPEQMPSCPKDVYDTKYDKCTLRGIWDCDASQGYCAKIHARDVGSIECIQCPNATLASMPAMKFKQPHPW
ncbi:Transmembrane protein C7orf23 [Balamuthia mandrillaris]